jgi:hypothetical protein
MGIERPGQVLPRGGAPVVMLLREPARPAAIREHPRGLGTTLGVAVVTLALHAAAQLGQAPAGPKVAMAALAVSALASAWAGRRVGTRPVRAGGHDSPAAPR